MTRAEQAVGIVTMSDLARAVESPEQIQETLREISEPHRSRKVEETETPEDADGPADGAENAEGRS